MSKALQLGSYKTIFQTNNQFAFLRKYENEKIIFAINIDDKLYSINLKEVRGVNILNNENIVDIGTDMFCMFLTLLLFIPLAFP